MIPLILGNKIIFLVILNFFLIIIFSFIILLIILYIKEKSKIVYYNIYINMINIVLQLFCFTFFGQIFGLLTVIFFCDKDNKTSIIDNSLKCRSGSLFYFECILCTICLIFMTYFSFTSISIYYKPCFIMEENDILKKSNSIPDLILFINKIIFIISIYSTKSNESYQWFILIIFFLSTLLNTLSLYYYNNYENIILMKLNKGLSLILFWSICSLIIGKIFHSWEFNGTIHLFLFGTFFNYNFFYIS